MTRDLGEKNGEPPLPPDSGAGRLRGVPSRMGEPGALGNGTLNGPKLLGPGSMAPAAQDIDNVSPPVGDKVPRMHLRDNVVALYAGSCSMFNGCALTIRGHS